MESAKENLISLLPDELFSRIIENIALPEIYILTLCSKTFVYLLDENSDIWKRKIPDGTPDSWSIRIGENLPKKVRISLNNIGIIEGLKTKWMMYKYIRLKQEIASINFDLKVTNSILVDQRYNIGRIKNYEIREKFKNNNKNLNEYRKKWENSMYNKINWMKNNFIKLKGVNERVTKENNENWKNIKTRMIINILLNMMEDNICIIYKTQLVKKIYSESNGKYSTCGLGIGKKSDILIHSNKLKINEKYISKMRDIVKDKYMKGNPCFVWSESCWYIRWVKDYDGDVIYLSTN